MQLLWLSHLVPYPPKGGVLQRSYHLLRETAKAHEVTLLSFIQSAHLSRRFPSVQEGLEEARRALSSFCRQVEFVPIPSERQALGRYRLAFKSLFTSAPYSVNWLKSQTFTSALRGLLGKQSFGVVHFDTISLAPYRVLLSGQKTALDHHNIESHLMLRRADLEKHPARKLYYRQEGWKLRRYESRVCPRFDAHITCSDLDSQRLLELAPGARAETIPNGVDLGYFTPGGKEAESPRSMIFAGGMNWYPNRSAILFFAREVWPRVKRDFPDATMDVLGFDPPAELTALAKADSTFRVHGFVQDVRPYLERAAVYVCPITDGGGTKLKVLDAFAMAKAVVAHPVACEGIDVKPGGNVLLASDAEEFAARIGFLFGNPEARRSLGAAARELIRERYAYETIGARLSALYASL